MIIRQRFTELETEVKWYFDSISIFLHTVCLYRPNCFMLIRLLLGPVAPTSLKFKSYLSPDLRTTYGRLYGS